MFHLYIGHKNYSSWSLRPWLLMKHFGIPFAETVVAVSGKGANASHRGYSDNGLVPCLHDDNFRVWDTIAICEYLAEQYPEMWPADRQARARARSICAEMHSGFGALRSQLPMNVRLRAQGVAPSPEVAADVARIIAIWRNAREIAATLNIAGDYLFGEFSIADAMYAPVIWRLYCYGLALPDDAQAYVNTMLAHPAMREWEAAALAETTRLPFDKLVDQFGGARV
ncbi:glutathione S-transferase family protein [Chitinibacter bivalviorum]|uniref:Glutathione S-transferase family protein n=1 Tax=Chitinibacter bivalviorum TaxID=2739434 RepID=A0A7H9BLE0_9NEIS|nr:glutathione S-transferase family protein [Chitinibacter bivalviorum]QLG89176.1 glutathione S-transferase family protein [Chitinibacter bivalviorum]